MEALEHIRRAIKLALASVLVVMLLALGGLAGVGASTRTGITTILTGARTTGSVNMTAAQGAAAATATVPAQGGTTTAGGQTQQQTGVVDARYAVAQTGKAVVTVVNTMQQSSTGRGAFGNGFGGQTAEALGSGVIISTDGYIVTNQHVVANQQSLEVIFVDGTRVPATLVGADAYSDIAVIKVNAKVPAVAQFGDSDKLEAGQPVVAIGTALGDFENTVTAGIVSGVHRQLDDGSTSSQDMIQTDAAINHGNSGGPLLDLNGKVIGINTAVVRSSGGVMGDVAEGLGFAIPSNTARSISDRLIKNGSISRPYLGISYQNITPQLAAAYNLSSQQGVYVSEVAAGSPAEQAGIQPNSIITKIDGTALSSNSNSTLPALLSKHNVGDKVTLTVINPGSTAEREVTVVLGARPNNQ